MFYYLRQYLQIHQLWTLKKVHLEEAITDICGNGLGGVYYELEDRVTIKSPSGKEVECVVLIDADGTNTGTYLIPVFNYWPESIEQIIKREPWEYEMNSKSAPQKAKHC